MAEELELKYSIDDARAVEAWLDEAFPPSPDLRWRTVSITDRYFDTADGALSGAGYGARLRRAGGLTTLTLKADIAVEGALHRRLELEGPATQSLTPDGWRQSDARDALVALIGGRRLVEELVVRQRRRERSILVTGTHIVASVDTAIVLAGGAEAGRLAQLELERRSGRRLTLQRVAHRVEASGLGRAESRSKLHMALELSRDASRVQPDDVFAEAGRKVLRRHLLRMLNREIGTVAGDPLALKQMRVATRRMRATWRVFEDGFKRSTGRRFVAQLRFIGEALGLVRDLDVLLAGMPKDQRNGLLAAQWTRKRESSFDNLILFLGSRPYARFVERMLEFTAEPGAGTAKRSAKLTVADRAPGALRDAFNRFQIAGTQLVGSEDAAAWHSLRIEGRRLRYSIEAFDDVLADTPTKELLHRVIRVQDHLGAMNDAAVAIEEASRCLADAATEVDEESAAAIGRYVSGRGVEIVDLRQQFGSVWRGMSGVTVERHLEGALGPLTNR